MLQTAGQDAIVVLLRLEPVEEEAVPVCEDNASAAGHMRGVHHGDEGGPCQEGRRLCQDASIAGGEISLTDQIQIKMFHSCLCLLNCLLCST